MRIYPNEYFGWPAQSWGFVYGSLAAVFRKPLQNFLAQNIRRLCGICIPGSFICGIVYLQIHTPEQESVEMYLLRVLISIFAVLLFLTLSTRVSLKNKVMSYLGKLSLYIFLLHGMIIDIFRQYFSDFWLNIVCIFATVFLAWNFYLMSHLRVMEKLKGVFKRKRCNS